MAADRETLQALLKERFQPVPRHRPGPVDGPTAEWMRLQAIAEAETIPDEDDEPVEGCPDGCGDTLTEDDDGTVYCTACGWRE